jgi:hypothetical protein
MAVISKADYLVLSTFLGDQSRKLIDAAAIARSGLVHVVLLQDVDQEVDLLFDYFSHSESSRGTRDAFPGRARGAVTALNNHVINRSGFTLNTWLPDTDVFPPAIKVTQDFADLSGAVGFTISAGNIAP